MQGVVLLILAGEAAAPAQTAYTVDGEPTGLEEEIRWFVNRGRFDTVSENQTRGTSYTDVPAFAGPLAPNQSITLASRHHSEDMARNNVFQHATVTNSAYYNPVTQANPWDRMAAEGYSWNRAAENIAAGYSGSETAYIGWWNSSGHRHNMYDANLREIGNGYYYWSSSTYRRYYTMDLGSSGSTYFFTDTLFSDGNTNGVYEQAEAISGVAIHLLVGTALHAYYDVSSAVGSFAIPIQAIASGATVQVVLSNTTPASLRLSIPRSYAAYSPITLARAERRIYGTFARPATLRNIGLRDVTPAQVVVAPSLALARSGADMLLRWPSEMGLQYLPQWTSNFQGWSNLVPNPLPGTGSNLTQLDAGATARSLRYYRLVVTKP